MRDGGIALMARFSIFIFFELFGPTLPWREGVGQIIETGWIIEIYWIHLQLSAAKEIARPLLHIQTQY
jgi:hypothetical protein